MALPFKLDFECVIVNLTSGVLKNSLFVCLVSQRVWTLTTLLIWAGENNVRVALWNTSVSIFDILCDSQGAQTLTIPTHSSNYSSNLNSCRGSVSATETICTCFTVRLQSLLPTCFHFICRGFLKPQDIIYFQWRIRWMSGSGFQGCTH